MMTKKRRVVVAIGGNAINREGEIGTIKEEFRNVRKALRGVIKILKEGHDIILTHGNGPQAGKSMLRVEAGMQNNLPNRPLGLIVADTQGGIGYMIEQSLQNRLVLENMNKQVVTVLAQVLVDKNDSSIKNPSKPVGSFYSQEEAISLIKEKKWFMKEDANRGWRRVVSSPKPKEIIEKDAIETLIDAGFIVITAGGGGIPVFRDDQGALKGIDCIVDKDFSSAILANQVKADTLLIATGVEKVSINFGKPNQKDLNRISILECKKYIAEGHFAQGSMLPKMQAAVKFIECGGLRAIITLPETLDVALRGETGTEIIY